MPYLIGAVVWGVIWGVATKIIINNKGYDDNWFWWGFFFGFIALIVACAMPQNTDHSAHEKFKQHNSNSSSNSHSGYSNIITATVNNEQLLANGGWKCVCGKVNASYVSSCSCKRSKFDVLRMDKEEEVDRKPVERNINLDHQKGDVQHVHTTEKEVPVDKNDEYGKIELIKKYKELMDTGVISQEEFEAKKKQLLDL